MLAFLPPANISRTTPPTHPARPLSSCGAASPPARARACAAAACPQSCPSCAGCGRSTAWAQRAAGGWPLRRRAASLAMWPRLQRPVRPVLPESGQRGPGNERRMMSY